jgi:hypothetical protein
VKYLTIILREEDDQQTDGKKVYKQVLLNAKSQIGKRGQKIADCKKSIKEVKFCIGL